MSRLEVYSDGSGEARVGRPGGWAWVIIRDDVELARGWGQAAHTTCLLMELEAAHAGLRAVLRREWERDHEVVLISDSSIVLDVAAGRFMPKPPKYTALAASLRAVALEARAVTKWVRAHHGHRWNEQVDGLARDARTGAHVRLFA